MRALNNRLDLDAIRAAERNVRQRHERRSVVNRIDDFVGRDRDIIVRVHHLDRGADFLLRVPDILHRREIQRGCDDLVALVRLKIETGCDCRKPD